VPPELEELGLGLGLGLLLGLGLGLGLLLGLGLGLGLGLDNATAFVIDALLGLGLGLEFVPAVDETQRNPQSPAAVVCTQRSPDIQHGLQLTKGKPAAPWHRCPVA
jgi:hypothetical protein